MSAQLTDEEALNRVASYCSAAEPVSYTHLTLPTN